MIPSRSKLKAICSTVFDDEISTDVLNSWLKQFNPDEYVYILHILSHFQYFSLKKTKATLKTLQRLLVNEIENFTESTVIIPIGYAAKSGGTISHLFRIENSLPEHMFVASTEISKLDSNRVKNIVFIDDFIGSGYQGINLWNYLTGNISETKLNKWTIYYAVVAGTNNGIAHLSENSRFKVISAISIDDDKSPLSSDSDAFTAVERVEFMEILKKYGTLLFPSHPLGYNRSQSLIGFFYSTPNNTLPIFWANHNNWQPLLPHGDVRRDPSYLLSPLAKAGLFNEKSNTLNRDIDDEVLSTILLSEFKTLRKAQLMASALQQLRVGQQVIASIIQTLRKLAFEEHERQEIICSLILVADSFDHKSFAEYQLYLSVDSLDVNHNNFRQLLKLSDATNCGVVVKASGDIIGLILYREDAVFNDDFLPADYRKIASSSRNIMGLAFLISGKACIDIIWDGQRILLHRYANWLEAYTKTEIDWFAAKWAGELKIRQMVINYCLAMANDMVHKGEGGFIIIGDTENILAKYADTKNHKLKFGEAEIFAKPMTGIERIVSQDGAVLIDEIGRIREFMVTIKLPTGIIVEQEIEKGTKHETAAKLSVISSCLCIAISIDRSFSVYKNGKLELRVNA